MSDVSRRRRDFSLKVLDVAHAFGLSGDELAAGLIDILAGLYANDAKGDPARFHAHVEKAAASLRANPAAPPRGVDLLTLLDDEELDAYEALIRAACRWTKPKTNKVGRALELIFAELRRLRARRV